MNEYFQILESDYQENRTHKLLPHLVVYKVVSQNQNFSLFRSRFDEFQILKMVEELSKNKNTLQNKGHFLEYSFEILNSIRDGHSLAANERWDDLPEETKELLKKVKHVADFNLLPMVCLEHLELNQISLKLVSMVLTHLLQSRMPQNKFDLCVSNLRKIGAKQKHYHEHSKRYGWRTAQDRTFRLEEEKMMPLTVDGKITLKEKLKIISTIARFVRVQNITGHARQNFFTFDVRILSSSFSLLELDNDDFATQVLSLGVSSELNYHHVQTITEYFEQHIEHMTNTQLLNVIDGLSFYFKVHTYEMDIVDYIFGRLLGMLEDPSISNFEKRRLRTKLIMIGHKCRYGASSDSQHFYDKIIS